MALHKLICGNLPLLIAGKKVSTLWGAWHFYIIWFDGLYITFLKQPLCVQLKLENGQDMEETEDSLPGEDLHDAEEAGEEQKRDIGPQPLPLKTAR